MAYKKGEIVNKNEFTRRGQYAKEQYEGLLVGSDVEQGYYNIGIQLDENKVLVVDQAKETNIRERIQAWVPQVQEIQRKYHVARDIENYSEM